MIHTKRQLYTHTLKFTYTCVQKTHNDNDEGGDDNDEGDDDDDDIGR